MLTSRYSALNTWQRLGTLNPSPATSTIDGIIFLLRQIMEKCREQLQHLHIAFIDFTKTFDCVNREFLFKILAKLGCPVNSIQIIRALYFEIQYMLDCVLMVNFRTQLSTIVVSNKGAS